MEFTNNIQYKHHLRALHQESTDVPTLGVIARQPDGFHCPECSYIHTNVENFRRHVHISALIKGARGPPKAPAPVSHHSNSLKRPHSPSPPMQQPSKQRLHSPEREAIIADTDPIIPDVPEVVSNQESENTEHKGQHLPANIDEILEAHDAAKEILHPLDLWLLSNPFPVTLHSSMLKHLSLEHPGSVAKDCIKACTVQIVFGRKRVGQFLEHLKAKELELEVLDVIQTPEDPRQTSIFLRRFQWLTATDGRPFKKLHGLTAKPVKKEQEFLDLEERVEGYFTRLRPLVMEMQPLVLKWINTPDEKGGINHRPFAYPQNDSSSEKYQAWGLRLICHVLRCVQTSAAPVLPVLLSDAQIKHAKAILTTLSITPSPTYTVFDPLIHSLLDSLFFSQHKGVSRHPNQCPVQSFIMCSAIDARSGNFEKCGTIVGRLSALLHILRLVAVKSIANKADLLDDSVENPEFEVCQPFCTRWLRQSQPSPFESIQSLDQYSTTVAYSEKHLPVFQWDAKHQSFSIKGHTVSLSKIGDMYTTLLGRMEMLLNELTEGIQTNVPAHKDIVDDMTEDTPGYCFASSHNGNIDSLRYLNLLAKDNTQWVYNYGTGGTVVWKAVKVAVWMSKAQELNELLLILMHIGGGQPDINPKYYSNGGVGATPAPDQLEGGDGLEGHQRRWASMTMIQSEPHFVINGGVGWVRQGARMKRVPGSPRDNLGMYDTCDIPGSSRETTQECTTYGGIPGSSCETTQ
ncbi:hypothetical protein BS47DRAFT_1358509 [Hydnum rufescens UP504]|uniref:Uncharacterized protein n=1 Tax=Hydnum rufescens UP504 TaxID=1448309 RepID=A0A9P6B7B6_9AGAM|nr:hypothetical protein BS47DRAFT_1358509 [Hydnum rufescens UP504]